MWCTVRWYFSFLALVGHLPAALSDQSCQDNGAAAALPFKPMFVNGRNGGKILVDTKIYTFVCYQKRVPLEFYRCHHHKSLSCPARLTYDSVQDLVLRMKGEHSHNPAASRREADIVASMRGVFSHDPEAAVAVRQTTTALNDRTNVGPSCFFDSPT